MLKASLPAIAKPNWKHRVEGVGFELFSLMGAIKHASCVCARVGESVCVCKCACLTVS